MLQDTEIFKTCDHVVEIKENILLTKLVNFINNYADLLLQVYVYFSKRTTLLRTFQVKESRERLKNWYVDYIYVFRGLKIQKV